MERSLETIERGTFEPSTVIDRVTLDLEARRKRRQALTGAGGTRFLADLAAVPSLKDGDGFRLESGQVIEVRAAPEALMEVTVTDPSTLPRIAWHLGNRHLPVQFVAQKIRFRADHVIEAMLQKLGAEVRPVDAPFDPEGGAYGHGHTHSHD
jgi:urease accessory protein